MKYFKPPWRQEAAPYGVEDVHAAAQMPCTTGYIARGFIDMNADLRIACDKIKERDEEIMRIKSDVSSILSSATKWMSSNG